MRGLKLWLGLIPGALMLSACAAPRPTEQHWGEAQRAASDAMIRAAADEPGRGIDAAGASAAHGNYVESLQPPSDEGQSVLLDIVESD
jgi:hypothetical protein